MDHTLHIATQPLRCLTFSHHTDGSLMRFHHQTWEHFPPCAITERLQLWHDAATGPWFRCPLSWTFESDELAVHLPALPYGYHPLPQIIDDLAETDWVRLLVSLAGAINHLHQHHFILGFIIPEHLYYRPETGSILLDIQPFPNAFPFVDNALPDYPYPLLSPYARQHVMPRIADFYGIGLLLEWLSLGHFPQDPCSIPSEVPAHLRDLCGQLIHAPEQFHSASEIACQLSPVQKLKPFDSLSHPVSSDRVWLHPMTTPILPKEQTILHTFLQKKGSRLLGLICEDEATRYAVYNEHFNAYMEKHAFFMIHCRNLPYSTLREMIERTIMFASQQMPFAGGTLQRLERKFERIISQHNTGGEIVHMLADWLFQLYRELLPLMKRQSFYYTLEDCEHLDEDTQRVLNHFWERYGEQTADLYAVFSGKGKPSLLSNELVFYLPIGQKSLEMYRRLLLSQLGKVENHVLDRLTQHFFTLQLDFLHVRFLLEEMVDRGELMLSTEGWQERKPFALAAQRSAAYPIIANRLALLEQKELDILRLLICLPRPVRAISVFRANGLDIEDLSGALNRLQRLGLARVFSGNSVYVPNDVAKHALYHLPQTEQAHYYQLALKYQQVYRPSLLPQLIELSVLSGDKRQEYYHLIRYYRAIRHLLMLERRKSMLENLQRLQQSLQRDRIICWDRLLFQIYVSLTLYEKAERTARSLLPKTGEAYDYFSLLLVLLFTNKLDVVSAKQELFYYLENPEHRLSDRTRAAQLIARINMFSPLLREGAEVVDRFYRQEFYPQRASISKRLFAEFTLSYVMVLYDFFPEDEEWASALRQKLESMLSHSSYHDLMIELYNSYLFHHNKKIAHTYNQRQLELSRRFGFKMKEEISHINGMEIAINLGDAVDYRYHAERVQRIGKLKRADLHEQYLNHQLLYACEWKQWKLFQQIENELLQLDLSEYGFFFWEVISRYAAFRRNEPLPPATHWFEENDATLFIDALYQVIAGKIDEAIQLFTQSIAANGCRIFTGWAMREMIRLLLEQQSTETWYWLDQLKRYLQSYAYDLFWPDYYRFCAAWYIQTGDRERSLLYMRRSSNIYQLIEKADLAHDLNRALEATMLPNYLEDNSPIAMRNEVKLLLQERNQLLQHSLDLQIIMQLSEQVTEELELTRTLQRLTHALFEYFPITLLAIDYQLFYQKEKIYYRASGSVKEELQLQAEGNHLCLLPYPVTLYQQGKQKITLEVYSPTLEETNRLHMEHFLSFIKPHIANALLYMEMMIDNLTGFYQRRYFMERLQQELALAKQYDLDLSVIMLDIDNFRLINLHGHLEGDRVLHELAEIVRGVLRQHDVPGRYGGEELLIILPKTDGGSALQLAREIRRQIEEAFDHRGDYKVTVSVGVSTLAHAQADTVDDLIRLADDAEIVAKKTGKNRVIAAWEM